MRMDCVWGEPTEIVQRCKAKSKTTGGVQPASSASAKAKRSARKVERDRLAMPLVATLFDLAGRIKTAAVRSQRKRLRRTGRQAVRTASSLHDNVPSGERAWGSLPPTRISRLLGQWRAGVCQNFRAVRMPPPTSTRSNRSQSILVCPGKAACASGNSDMHRVCSTVMHKDPEILVEDA